MEIVDNRGEKEVCAFGELRIGELFVWKGEEDDTFLHPRMKLNSVSFTDLRNAIHWSTAISTDRVIRLSGKLIIENA